MVVSVVLVVSLVAFLFTNKGEGAHHPHKNFGGKEEVLCTAFLKFQASY